MKSTSEYLALLRRYMAENKAKYSIVRMGIFGSVARNEQKEGSDVDVCVETSKPSLFALVHIKEELQALFGCSVDVVRLRERLGSLFKSRIEKGGIYVCCVFDVIQNCVPDVKYVREYILTQGLS